MKMYMKKCPWCGTINHGQSQDCKKCLASLYNVKGFWVDAMKSCPKCGTKNEPTNKDQCSKCGEPLKDVDITYDPPIDSAVQKTKINDYNWEQIRRIDINDKVSGSKIAKVCAIVIGILGFIVGFFVSYSDYLESFIMPIMFSVWALTLVSVIFMVLIYYHLKNQEDANEKLEKILEHLDKQ